tara:strand:- start:775 stop:1638 length:864 start_codon:yes stop_codon:yes gene_type:complete
MNRIIIILLLSLTFNIINIKNSHAVGAGVFKSIFKLFSKNADEATGAIKKGDEVLNGSKAKNAELPAGAIAEEASIISKIGEDLHQGHYSSSKKDSLSLVMSKHGIIFKRAGKQIVENSDNIYELFSNGASSEQKKFYSYIILNWVGKIYRFSNYFNEPSYENRNLLVCKNLKEIFYFTILMENKDDINRALLTEHKFLNSSEKTLPKQELLVLRDDEHVKIMSVKPTNDSSPTHFFTIYENQHFLHSTNADVQTIINNADNKPNYVARTSKCYKAKEDGLMIASNN